MNQVKKAAKEFTEELDNLKVGKRKPEQGAGEILTTIRQFEPEDQNEIMRVVLKELAIDRHNSVRQHGEARDRASKNLDTLMTYALGIEKLMSEAMSEPKRF